MVLASLGGFGVFGLVLAGIGTKRNRRHMAVLGIVLLVTMFTFIGCGGGSSNSGTNPSVPGTPAGTYTVTVTAAGNGTSAPTHTMNVTLIVQ
jgi:ABC-type glycerol-3-phosphate transport system substrate-binding protein